MKIIPFGFNILVKPIEKTTVLVGDKGGLCEYGEVVAIGKDVKEIKIGDTIGYSVFGIKPLDIYGTRYYFVPEAAEFLLGTVELS